MKRDSRAAGTAAIVAALAWIMLGAFLTVSCSAEEPLVAFLKKIGYLGRTPGQMQERLGAPSAITRSVEGRLETNYYYTGLQAQFDDYAGRISLLSITDGRWEVDSAVSIGSAKAEVAAALGDGYVRLTGDGDRDVWVYFCPRPSSDPDAALCDYCRVCYISFENDRVSKIEWSAELMGDYSMPDR